MELNTIVKVHYRRLSLMYPLRAACLSSLVRFNDVTIKHWHIFALSLRT
jgi:hypothetical protein